MRLHAPRIALASLLGAGLLLLAGPAAAQTAGPALLVPAYANPCCAGGLTLWPDLIASAASGSVPIHAILNPASGPGTSPIDPNYVNVGGVGPAVDLDAAGGRLYGYVATTFGARPLAAVEADIDVYYDPAYWRGAGVLVRGIFLDEMSNDLASTGYYQTLTAYVKSKDAGARVFGNPGTPFTQDTSGGTSGFTVADYAGSVDTIVTFENTGAAYRTSYTAPSWLATRGADHFAHIVHSEPASADMLQDLQLAAARKAGFVYVTDDVLPNPFDFLASYWSAEAAALVPTALPALTPLARVLLGIAVVVAFHAGLRRTRRGSWSPVPGPSAASR